MYIHQARMQEFPEGGSSMRHRFNMFEVFSDIKKSNSSYQKKQVIFLYQAFEFLISKNHFSDIRKYLKNIKTGPHIRRLAQ